MPNYIYKAKNEAAETVTGQIVARNQEDAVELISQKGLLPISVEKGIIGRPKGSRSPVNRKIKPKDIYVFNRQLATLIKSGVPILRALMIISQQEENQTFKDLVSSCSQGISNGRSLSECLADYPKVFSPFYVSMVHVGEEGGNLKEILLRVSKYQRSQQELSSKVRMALAYPILMLVLGVATVVFILTFIMPKITNLFSSMGAELPLVTKILIRTSNFLSISWFWLFPLMIGIGITFQKWTQTISGRHSISRFLLRIPVYGSFILKSELARFTRTLGLLLNSGIPLIKALRVVVPILGNEIVKETLIHSEEDLKGGLTLGDSLKSITLIPTIMSNMIAIGEESGSLESTLNDIAENYEQETNETIKKLTTLIEPIMILFIGLIIGFIVMAILLPIFQIDVLAQ